jgi:hypothetical protein
MRAFEILTESTGGIARRWLEKQSGKDIHFLDNQGTRWDLEDVSFWPKDPELAYETNEQDTAGEQLKTALDPYLKEQALASTKVFGEKSPNAKSVAAMVVVVSDGSKKVGYILQTNKKASVGNNPIKWENTKFLTDTGLTVQTAQMKKAVVPLEPSDFFNPRSEYSIEQVVSTVAGNLNKASFPQALQDGIPKLLDNIITGDAGFVPNLLDHAPVIQVKLSEIASPIALITGNLVSGAYQQSNKELLEPLGGTWSSASGISFADRGEELVDSFIHLPGGKVGISTKAGTGAKPSVKSIIETLEAKKDQFEPAFLTDHADIIEDLKIIYSGSAIDSIFELAVKHQLVDSAGISYIKSIYSKGPVDPSNTPDNLNQLIKTSSYQRLDRNHPEYQLGYHILAVLAQAVAAHFNKDRNRITNFFKAILNKANMVQVLTKTASKGDALRYSQFNVIWPPVFQGNILVNAGHYTSRTRPSRKISFEFR